MLSFVELSKLPDIDEILRFLEDVKVTSELK